MLWPDPATGGSPRPYEHKVSGGPPDAVLTKDRLTVGKVKDLAHVVPTS